MIKTVPYNFTPRSYQLELYKALDSVTKPVKRAILKWHRRAGKDKSCFCYMVKQAYQVPGNYFYIFPTKEDARKAFWENIDKDGRRMIDHVPTEIVLRISNVEMLLEIKSGKNLSQQSTIRVVGYDKNPDAIRGVSCKGAVFSEFAFADPECYKILVPALRESGGWAIFESTPNGRNHFFDLWERVKNSQDWYVSELQTYWPKRPNYSGLVKPEELQEIQEQEGYTDEDMEREYGAEFSTGLKGSYYIDQIDRARETGRINTFLYDETKPVNTLWDLGASDANACWFYQSIGNSTVFIDYWEDNGNSVDSLVRMLLTKNYRYDTHYLPHDAGPERQRRDSNVSIEDDFNDALNDFRVTGKVSVIAKPNKKQPGILAVRNNFSKYCFDSLKCVVGIRHLELYHKSFDKRRNIFSDEPVHDEHSHAADGLRLEPETVKNYSFQVIPKTMKYGEYDIRDGQ